MKEITSEIFFYKNINLFLSRTKKLPDQGCFYSIENTETCFIKVFFYMLKDIIVICKAGAFWFVINTTLKETKRFTSVKFCRAESVKKYFLLFEEHKLLQNPNAQNNSPIIFHYSFCQCLYAI